MGFHPDTFSWVLEGSILLSLEVWEPSEAALSISWAEHCAWLNMSPIWGLLSTSIRKSLCSPETHLALRKPSEVHYWYNGVRNTLSRYFRCMVAVLAKPGNWSSFHMETGLLLLFIWNQSLYCSKEPWFSLLWLFNVLWWHIYINTCHFISIWNYTWKAAIC